MAQTIDRSGSGGDDPKKQKNRTPIDLDAALQEAAKAEQARKSDDKARAGSKAKARAKAKRGGREIPQPLLIGVLSVVILVVLVWGAMALLGGDKRPSLSDGTAGFGATGGKPNAQSGRNAASVSPQPGSNVRPLYGTPRNTAVPGAHRGGEASENGIGN